jgi:GH35 family endo-1,4-beta-xylanase
MPTWNLSDRYSWLKLPGLATARGDHLPRRPLPFDVDFNRKPI